MPTNCLERYIVYLALWPTWLRFTLPLQGVICVTWIASSAARIAAGRAFLERDDEMGVSVIFLLVAVTGLLCAVFARYTQRVVLTEAGLLKQCFRGKRIHVLRWSEPVEVIRVSTPLGRWFRLCPVHGTSFFDIPQRPADLDAAREAAERFAGPDHPLTCALTEAAEGA